MSKNIFYILTMVFVVAGCRSDATVPSQYVYDDISYTECPSDAAGGVIQYSTPNGNDLVLETAHHVIQIDAQPDVAYDYHVWVGDKTYEFDPDLVVSDGTAYILQDE